MDNLIHLITIISCLCANLMVSYSIRKLLYYLSIQQKQISLTYLMRWAYSLLRKQFVIFTGIKLYSYFYD